MTISTSSIRCEGFETNTTISIKYDVPSDIQKSYHVNPGQRYRGKRTVAYLPNNLDGRDLLKRLKYAFMHGLTFTVGTSMTTNEQNQCTWSSIHHKSQPSGGFRLHVFLIPTTSTIVTKNWTVSMCLVLQFWMMLVARCA